jgi:hypothetical protein
MTLFEECSGAVLTGLLLIGSAMIDVSDPVIVTIGGGILAALTGTVKVLWDRNNKLSLTTDVALAKCEEEHRKASVKYDDDRKELEQRMTVLIDQVIKLSGEVGMLQGRIQGFQEATAQHERKADHGA